MCNLVTANGVTMNKITKEMEQKLYDELHQMFDVVKVTVFLDDDVSMIEDSPKNGKNQAENIKTGPKQFECKFCGKKYTREVSWKEHVKRIHEGKVFSCQQYSLSEKCDKSFMTKPSLQLHIKKVHERKNYHCKICRKAFSWPFSLKQHKKRVHNE